MANPDPTAHTPYKASEEEREHIREMMATSNTWDLSFDRYLSMYHQEIALYEEQQDNIRVDEQLAIWGAQIAYDIATTPVPVVPVSELSQWEADSWQEAPISGVVENDAMDLLQQEERHMFQEEAIEAASCTSFWDVLNCPLGKAKGTFQSWRVSKKLASAEAELSQWDQAMAKVS